MQKDYVSVIYDEKRVPKTDYPVKLATYLSRRFDIEKGDKLLEIGCGRGEFLKAFANLGINSYGVDISDYCAKNKVSSKVACVDISKNKFPYENNSFDCVYHKSLIEHFYSPEHIMKETYRVLKPGGKIIVLTPDWVSQMKVFYEDFTHCRPYDKQSLHDALNICGFSDVHTKLFYQLPAVWKYPFLKMLSCIIRMIFSTKAARKITQITGIQFFRWSVELMILGYGKK